MNKVREKQLMDWHREVVGAASGRFMSALWEQKLVKNLYQSTVFGEASMKKVNEWTDLLGKGPDKLTIKTIR